MYLPEAHAIEAYQLRQPTPRIIGKLLHDPLDHCLVLFRSHDESTGVLHKWDAWSFDARLLPILEDAGVEYVDQEDKNGLVWRAPLALYVAEGWLDAPGGPEGEQVYLGRDMHRAGPPHYKPSFTHNVRVIDTPPPVHWVPIKEPQRPALKPSAQKLLPGFE